ncbi:MAG: NADH-quinone oxidoreductase subunit L, partial [Candidatus Sulfotelmatobacter sp.]
LWRAYSSEHGSWIFWLIGFLTAFITSFYMFRLWFLTFLGDYRGVEAVETAGHGGGHGSAHSHGNSHDGHGLPHESPMVMIVPLAILAVLSFVGGWVGIGNRFENFLAPVFQVGAIATAETTAETTGHLELYLMLVSVAAAFLGLYLAYLLYHKRKDLPQKIADSLGGFYQAVVHKYYIDELYATLFVKPLIDGSTRILWHDVDQKVIDAAVNDSAHGARHASDEVRQMQSGNIRSYAAWIAAGSAAVIAFMIWMGVR